MADWVRDVVAAAEERGWAVIQIDGRQSSVILEEPMGGGLSIVIRGQQLDGDFIRKLPEARGVTES